MELDYITRINGKEYRYVATHRADVFGYRNAWIAYEGDVPDEPAPAASSLYNDDGQRLEPDRRDSYFSCGPPGHFVWSAEQPPTDVIDTLSEPDNDLYRLNNVSDYCSIWCYAPRTALPLPSVDADDWELDAESAFSAADGDGFSVIAANTFSHYYKNTYYETWDDWQQGGGNFDVKNRLYGWPDGFRITYERQGATRRIVRPDGVNWIEQITILDWETVTEYHYYASDNIPPPVYPLDSPWYGGYKIIGVRNVRKHCVWHFGTSTPVYTFIGYRRRVPKVAGIVPTAAIVFASLLLLLAPSPPPRPPR